MSASDGKKWLDVEPWSPLDAPLKGSLPRSRGQLLRVVAQFRVETSMRYKKDARTGDTKCNIFSWDVTSAMGAEIPHWVAITGLIVGKGQGIELNANRTMIWLKMHGHKNGWIESTSTDAWLAAENGEPAVAVWENPIATHSGHIAVVVPSPSGEVYVAQAGAKNFSLGRLSSGFGKRHPTFFAHK